MIVVVQPSMFTKLVELQLVDNSKLLSVVILSTIQDEYVARFEATKMIWLHSKKS